MSESNGQGQYGQLPMAWPADQSGGAAPALPPAPPLYGSTPPGWTGASQADAQAHFAAQAVHANQAAAQLAVQAVTAPAGEKDAAQLVTEAKWEAAFKKAKKLAENELRKKWATPWDRFNAWQGEFGFTLDMCADETNHKLQRWIGPNSPVGVLDYNLVQMLPGERIWWNSPGFTEADVKLAWQLMGQAPSQRPQLIVQIRPANQTEQPFWQEYVEQYRDFNGYAMLQPMGIDFRVRFLTPRVEFVPPGPTTFEFEGKQYPVEIKESSPRSGHVLLIWRAAHGAT